MSERTGIEWTQRTYNPWQGCTKVSPGCAHCYMYREKAQYGQDPHVVVRSKPPTFGAPLKWREPALVFTCSWSDWFHEAADPWRAEAWAIVKATPHLTYQILTKRAARIRDHLPADWGQGYPNVWLGVSVENQRWIDRVYQLGMVPAHVRFVSAEPLLGPVDLTQPDPSLWHRSPIEVLQWVIVGGESGPGYRPMDLAWARSLRDQCAAAGVPFFLKQNGGWPNKRGGALAVLDGQRHTAMPEAVPA